MLHCRLFSLSGCSSKTSECNKFREHQAREILIEVLEKQLVERRETLADLQAKITRADELLGAQSDET